MISLINSLPMNGGPGDEWSNKLGAWAITHRQCSLWSWFSNQGCQSECALPLVGWSVEMLTAHYPESNTSFTTRGGVLQSCGRAEWFMRPRALWMLGWGTTFLWPPDCHRAKNSNSAPGCTFRVLGYFTPVTHQSNIGLKCREGCGSCPPVWDVYYHYSVYQLTTLVPCMYINRLVVTSLICGHHWVCIFVFFTSSKQWCRKKMFWLEPIDSVVKEEMKAQFQRLAIGWIYNSNWQPKW